MFGSSYQEVRKKEVLRNSDSTVIQKPIYAVVSSKTWYSQACACQTMKQSMRRELYINLANYDQGKIVGPDDVHTVLQ